jgi:hypothetical protein
MRALAAALAVTGLASIAQAASPAAGPRVAIVVGNDRGGGRAPLRFATKDAVRVRDVLVTLGHADRVELLLDADASELDEAIERVSAELAAAPGGTVMFYYSGHADDRALMMGATRYRYRDLRARLAGLPARLYVAVLDACQSGSATRAKGGQAVPLVDVKVFEPEDDYRGGVFLTSSAPGELSHESDQIQASFFTHALLTGLRGAADRSRDGRVSLTEAYEYAYRATVSRTQGSLHGTQHPTADLDIEGRGQLVLTWLDRALAYLVLPAGLEGTYLVESLGSDGFIAELDEAAGRPVRLALSSGRYEVSTVRDGVRMFKQVRLQAPSALVFDAGDMESEPLALSVTKGGAAPSTLGLRVGYRLGSGFLVNAAPSHGVGAAVLWPLGPLDLGLGTTWTSARYTRQDLIEVELHRIEVSTLAETRWKLASRLVVLGGLQWGAAWVSQVGQRPGGPREARAQLVIPVAARAGFEVPIHGGVSAVAIGRAGFVVFEQLGRVRWPFEGGVDVGVRLDI